MWKSKWDKEMNNGVAEVDKCFTLKRFDHLERMGENEQTRKIMYSGFTSFTLSEFCNS